MTKTAAKDVKPQPADSGKILGTYGTMYYVKDMKKSVEWFSSRLGLKPDHESKDWTEFHLGGHALCLHLAKKDPYPANGSLILHVGDIKGIVASLKKAGATVEEPHEVHPGAWAADVRDPDGNVLSVYEGPKGG
jgi:catechol 2,3-dioxygenase-like lactoylglutathione lyase family enzyme